ncbi:hypothetical protein Tco_1075079 [Tanacetum coccineum]
MLVELIAEKKKFFAGTREQQSKESKPPTKTQIRNRMCTYLKQMGGYKHNQLKGRSYEEIQKLFDLTYKQVNTFVPMDSEVMKSKERNKEKVLKVGNGALESDKYQNKQKIDDMVELLNVTPLAIKPPVIDNNKDCQGEEHRREDFRDPLEVGLKLGTGNIRLEDEYERVL